MPTFPMLLIILVLKLMLAFEKIGFGGFLSPNELCTFCVIRFFDSFSLKARNETLSPSRFAIRIAKITNLRKSPRLVPCGNDLSKALIKRKEIPMRIELSKPCIFS